MGKKDDKKFIFATIKTQTITAIKKKKNKNTVFPLFTLFKLKYRCGLPFVNVFLCFIVAFILISNLMFLFLYIQVLYDLYYLHYYHRFIIWLLFILFNLWVSKRVALMTEWDVMIVIYSLRDWVLKELSLRHELNSV